MADKLGTLEYDMLINEEKLTKQLQDIDKLLQEQDAKWKKSLSNVGSGSIASIDTSKLVTANKAVVASTEEISGSIKKLRADLKKNQTAYEALSTEEKRNSEAGKERLALITRQKDQLAELEKSYKQLTLAKKADAAEEKRLAAQADKTARLQSVTLTAPDEIAKLKAINKELEYQRNIATDPAKINTLNRTIVANQQLIDKKKEESKLADKLLAQDLQRQKLQATVNQYQVGTKENLDAKIKLAEFEKRISTEAGEANDRLSISIRKLKDEKKQLIQTEREAEKQSKVNLQRKKLEAAVNAQEKGSIDQLRASNRLLQFEINQISVKSPDAAAKLRSLNAAIAANRQQINALKPTVNLWGKLVSAIRTYATAYLSVQAVIGLGRAAFTQTKELDQLAFSMKTVIQNSVELAKTQKFLSDVAVNYGGDLLTLSERYIKFRAAAIQSNVAASETQKIFDSVSKAAGTLGLKTDELSGVYLALEQMLSKGKVTTEELRRQLGERLPGAFGIMANALGVTIPELDKMLKKGEVLSTVALPKFAAALEKAYGIESLKKIDTLAAAQGRMSTQFTELIRSVNASDGFKGAINAIADFFGIINDNIKVIGFFAKAMLIAGAAITAWKIEQFLANKVTLAASSIKAGFVAMTTKQTVATIGFKTATQQATVAQNSAAAATSRWSLAFKTFGGWIGIIVNLLITAVSYFLIFGKETKQVTDAMTELSQQQERLLQVITTSKRILSETTEGTNRYKNALKELNNVGLKYNQDLLTENNTRKEINKSIEETIKLIKEEYLEKRRVALLEQATLDLEPKKAKLESELFKYFEDPTEAYDKLIQFQDLVESGANFRTIFENISGGTGLRYTRINNILEYAAIAYRKYYEDVARIEKEYGTGKNDTNILFDLDGLKKDLAAAKEEFEKIEKIGFSNIAEGVQFFDEEKEIKTYKDYLQKRLKETIGNSILEKQAREAILLELADIEDKDPTDKRYERLLKNRNEAIAELNKKYLQDKEDFVNADLGISAGRIAALEDGIIKEQKLNELAYQNKLKAIDKDTAASLKLLNKVAGTENKPLITSLDFDVTEYSKEVQRQMDDLRASEAKKIELAARDRNEKELLITKEYSDKIKEIHRDVNDEFLTGLQKEKAAIKEKYDDWEKRAAQADPLNLTGEQENIAQARATANKEIEISYQIDQLDFFREIEYKKNEIALFGAINRRKLEKTNFDTYVQYEQKRIKLLKASGSLENLQKAADASTNLILDEELFKLQQQSELRKEILSAAQDMVGVLREQGILSGELADQLETSLSIFSKLGSGDWLGAAVSFASELIRSVTDVDESNRKLSLEEKRLEIYEKTNKTLERQLSILRDLSGDDYFELATKQAEDLKIAIESDLETLRTLTKQKYPLYLWFSGIEDWSVDDFIAATTVGYKTLMGDYFIELEDEEQKYLDSILEKRKEFADLMQETFERILGFNSSNVADEIFSGIEQGFKLSEYGLGDFAQSFGELMKKALMQSITEAMNVRITEGFLTQYREFLANDGTLDENEKKILEQSYADIVRQAEIDSANISAITDKYTSQESADYNGISRAIQGVTEDTARRLEGLINSIRETTVNSYSNNKELLYSNQQIQIHASNSLAELKLVNSNLVKQYDFFNGLVGASGTSGKGGLRVVVQ